MILGLGIDIVEVNRIRQANERSGFSQRILTERERFHAESRHDPTAYLAKRFAAKEAVAKALGVGIGKQVSFQDVEVLNLDSGQPVAELFGNARVHAEQLGVTRIHISISDTEQHAIAQVILEGEGG